ncbi:MAG: hypothetical protein EB162_04240 [Euryarchaeota archaeon]|nr:hypothetical protein [Euryarchaeota archaeon]
MRSIMPLSSSMRAMDQLFEGLARMSGFRSPLDMSTRIVKEAESMIVNDAEQGIYTVYKLVPRTYRIEREEDGSILHRLLTEDEVKALSAPEKKEAA